MSGSIYDLLSDMSERVDRNYIREFYYENEINYERLTLYRDFMVSLFETIVTTYLGDDVTPKKYRKGHFLWSWEKTINDFKLEKINLNDEKLFKYLWDFFNDMYYTSHNKTSELINSVKIFLLMIFSIHEQKTINDLEYIKEIYDMFENALENID